MQHKLREDIRRLTANIESNFSNPDKQLHVAVWRAVRDIRRKQFRRLYFIFNNFSGTSAISEVLYKDNDSN